MYKDMYVALSGAVGMQKRLDVVANNLANVSTPGFKADNIVFESYLSKKLKETEGQSTPQNPKPEFMRQDEYVVASEQYTDHTQGAARVTENPLDIALAGEGFLAVMTYDGERYTRAGSMKVGARGELATEEGAPVLDENDRLIYVNDGFVTIDEEGHVYVRGDTGGEGGEGRLAGKLKLVDFAQPYRLVKEGSGLFRAYDPADMVSPRNLKVHQGHLENSNVEMIREMTAMIEVQRMTEAFQKAIQSSDQMSGTLISQIGR